LKYLVVISLLNSTLTFYGNARLSLANTVFPLCVMRVANLPFFLQEL